MTTASPNMLAFIQAPTVLPLLTQISRGIEKESLRADANQQLALTPHPKAFGSALCNPWITTDFSEALLEFITPVCPSIDEAIHYLEQLHRYTLSHLQDEIIWPSSMPCILPSNTQIPLANYGNSNIGQMKTTYRRGLGHRYGRTMQTVAGIHYNFSLPESFWQQAYQHEGATGSLQAFIDKKYLGLIRNFRRWYWLLIYLFGAAPVVDKSFVQHRTHHLELLNEHSYYLPTATSLRMSDLGYQSKAQKDIFVCYNSLQNYIHTLNLAIHGSYRDYVKYQPIDGQHQQLSDSLLQIENEFYSPIRPKRVCKPNETPLQALNQRGIEYIEVRCIDVNPFNRIGIDAETIRFLDCFLLHCLLAESPACDEEDLRLSALNQTHVVEHGRSADLKIYCNKQAVDFANCASALINHIESVAKTLDQAHATSQHMQSLKLQRARIQDTNLTLSGRLLNELERSESHFTAFSAKQSKLFAEELLNLPIDTKLHNRITQDSTKSFAQQKAIEESDAINFDDFLKQYFEQARI